MQNRIKEIRVARGMSAAKLAEIVGTSQQQIDRLEKSQRRLDISWIERLSAALLCEPSDIVPQFANKTELIKKIEKLNRNNLNVVEALVDAQLQNQED